MKNRGFDRGFFSTVFPVRRAFVQELFRKHNVPRLIDPWC
jgi:hypothetical protein